jgi:hypothetical protein
MTKKGSSANDDDDYYYKLLLKTRPSATCVSAARIIGRILPITVAARSKARTVFARSNAGIVASNPTQGMDVCVRLFCVCVVLCVGSSLATCWSPSKESSRLCIGLRNWKSGQGPTKGL